MRHPSSEDEKTRTGDELSLVETRLRLYTFADSLLFQPFASREAFPPKLVWLISQAVLLWHGKYY